MSLGFVGRILRSSLTLTLLFGLWCACGWRTDTKGQIAFSGERFAQIVAEISAGADSSERRSAILRRLDELKLKYRLEEFCSGSVCGVNVVVEPNRPRAKTLLLGAHYDRVSEGRGAVDNASGVASVLELLSRFRKQPLRNYAVAAAFFDLEESQMLGAKAYVSARQQHRALPTFYLNFDVIAYGDTLFVTSKTESSPLGRVMRKAASQQEFSLVMEAEYPPGDDQVFLDAGVETLGIGLVPGDELAGIRRALRGEEVTPKPSLLTIVHSKHDTPDKIRGEAVARGLVVVEAAIRLVDAGLLASSRMDCATLSSWYPVTSY